MCLFDAPGISRRDFLAAAGLAGAAACLTPRHIFAEDASLVTLARASAAKAEVTIQRLRGNLSVLLGSGGNIAVLSGPDGKLLVDAGFPASEPKIMAALAAIGPEPIKHLVNTHWHFDHTDGNEWLHAAGAAILAHGNARKHLAATTRVADWNFTFPPAPAGALPTSVVTTGRTWRWNGTRVALTYYGPSHTDSDISVSFSDVDVFHTGDTWWNGVYPFIDYSTGGSITGMIQATDANLATVTSTTTIIPGHGPVGDKSQLSEYRDMLITIRDKVGGLKKRGASLEDVVAAKPTAAYDARWSGFLIDGDFFTRLVYEGV